MIESPLRLLGYGIAIVILGPFNPVIRPAEVEQYLGIQDNSWQHFMLIGVWVLAIYFIYAIFLSVVEFATKRYGR